MQSLFAKWWKRVALAALVLVLLAGGLVVLVLNHNGLQDRLAKGALTRAVAQQMERSAAYGGDNLDLVFCGTAWPMGNADGRSNAWACWPVTSFSLLIAARAQQP